LTGGLFSPCEKMNIIKYNIIYINIYNIYFINKINHLCTFQVKILDC